MYNVEQRRAGPLAVPRRAAEVMVPMAVRLLRSTSARLLCAFVAAFASPVDAQGPAPTIRGLLSGYGSVGYSVLTHDDLENDFTGFLALVPLFQISDDLLVEGELEFSLHDNQTLVTLEHAQLHYLGFERVQLKAGRFHLPVGVWSHTSWVNKMPAPPLLYEDAHGEPAQDALMPIPFDLGAMVRWTLPTQGWRTSAAVWVSQGPRPGAGNHHEEGGEAEPAAPPLAYGSNYADNNSDKMVGLRLRTVSGVDLGLTLDASAFRAAYDDAGDLAVRGANVGLIWAPGGVGEGGLFDLRAEATILSQEYLDSTAAVEEVRSGGYYLQLSRRLGAVEPIVRWSHLPEATAGGGHVVERRRQLGVGVNYWISASVPVKAAYYFERDRTDQFLIEWAVGF